MSKTRKPVYRGCPHERESHFRCIAHNDNGRLCKEPASVLDPARGGFVCERHASELVHELEIEALPKQVENLLD